MCTEIMQKLIDPLLPFKLRGFTNSMLDIVFTTSTTLVTSNSVPKKLKIAQKRMDTTNNKQIKMNFLVH
jgi:hypothetical protein